MPELKPVIFQNARLIFRNFAGREGKFNREGDRSFGVVIPDESVAQQMLRDGWNIKYPNPRENMEEGESYPPYLPVAVNYKFRAPRITTITPKSRTLLSEDLIDTIDGMDIAMCDLSVNPSPWDVNGKQGIKAYLRSMFITMEMDELDLKYDMGDEG